jgi:hypothetical protein
MFRKDLSSNSAILVHQLLSPGDTATAGEGRLRKDEDLLSRVRRSVLYKTLLQLFSGQLEDVVGY